MGNGQLQALGTLSDLRKQAKLPLKIQIQGELNQDILCSELENITMDISSLDDKTLEINALESQKVHILREIMKHPGVSDVDIHTPSLEQLYRYFVENDVNTGNIDRSHFMNSQAKQKEGVQ